MNAQSSHIRISILGHVHFSKRELSEIGKRITEAFNSQTSMSEFGNGLHLDPYQPQPASDEVVAKLKAIFSPNADNYEYMVFDPHAETDNTRDEPARQFIVVHNNFLF